METNNEPVNQPYQPFMVRMVTYLPYLEIAFLAIVLIGVALSYTTIPAHDVLIVGFIGLAGTFFLSAYKPPFQIEIAEGGKKGFKELLLFTIVPKVLWMSCSVSAVAICFYWLGLKGEKEMLQMAGLAIAGGLFLLGFAVATGAKNINLVVPILYRAIPLGLLDWYLLLR